MTPRTGTGLQVTVLDNWQAVESLADEWRPLLEGSSANCIFLTPEWIFAWRTAMEGLDIQPYVVTVRGQDNRLHGLGLYYQAMHRLAGTVPYRMLRAMGDFASGAVYHDIIASPADADCVRQLVMSTLAASSADAVWMPHTSNATGASSTIRSVAEACGFHVESRHEEFFCIDLPGTFEDYEKQLSAATRKDLRRATRKLLAPDGANLRICSDPADLDTMLATLIEMNTQRWEGSDQGGVFQRKPREATFYRQFARAALERGWLRFLQLDIEGKPAAMEIGYRYGDRYYALQGCYDIHGPAGTGKVLLMQMVKRVLEEGVRWFDLLSGDFSYKQRYGAAVSEMTELFLVRKSMKTLPLRLAGVWPRGRYLDFGILPEKGQPGSAAA